MAFNRFDESRSSYHFEKPRGRNFFRGESPLSSPLFARKKQLQNGGSGPSSLASSRDSSLDRTLSLNNNVEGKGSAPYGGLHNVVTRVCSREVNPKKLAIQWIFSKLEDRSASLRSTPGYVAAASSFLLFFVSTCLTREC